MKLLKRLAQVRVDDLALTGKGDEYHTETNLTSSHQFLQFDYEVMRETGAELQTLSQHCHPAPGKFTTKEPLKLFMLPFFLVKVRVVLKRG